MKAKKNGKMVAKEESIYKRFPEATLNNTTLKYLDQAPGGESARAHEPIRVFPNEVIFQDIEVGKGEEMTVLVKNVTRSMKRIKVKQPVTSKFFCDYRSTGPLAPGLSMELIVSFKTNEEGTNFSDEIQVIPEGESPIRIPLRAFTRTWHIVYQPFVNFGFMDPAKPVAKEIVFSNEGDNTADVVLAPSPSELVRVDETFFEVKARAKRAIRVTMTGQKSGELMNGYLGVTVGGEQREQILLYAVIVQQVLSVVFENGAGQTSEINFGSLFFGEFRDCNAVLVNNGPKPINFNISFTKEGSRGGEATFEDHGYKAPRELGLEMMDREMCAAPVSGRVAGYSEVPIMFSCKTKKNPKFHAMEYVEKKEEGGKGLELGFDKSAVDYHYVAHLQYDDDQEIPIVMRAHACLPRVSVKTGINFGKCRVNKRMDNYLKIQNNTDDLPVPFELTKTAHFHTDPIKGKLFPQSQQLVLVSFQPRNLGVFSSSVNLSLVGGIYSVPIKLYGIARKIGKKKKELRGPEATARDFEQGKRLYEEGKGDSESEEEEAKRVAGSSIPRWLKESTTWQVEEGLKDNMAENLERLEYRKTQQQYNTFLKEQRKQREHLKLNLNKVKRTAKSPPTTLEQYINDIDLNLEEGRPPSPKVLLSISNDPLWVMKAVGKHEPNAIESKRQVEFDCHRPLRKLPYDTHPKGGEQIQHCTAELTGSQLQKIQAGPIDIDFGDIFVNSEELRYFNAINDLHEFIMIRFVPMKEISVIPEQQVIPGGSEASFTLKLKSNSPQDLLKPLTYTINDKHTFKIRIKAKVEPVKLDVVPTNLPLRIEANTQNMTCVEFVDVRNKGNWQAMYNVKLKQDRRAFEVQEGEYTLGRQENKPLKVTYTPSPDVPQEDAIILIAVKDGEEIAVHCRGSCPTGNCDIIGGAELDFGEVQVGEIETEPKCIKLKNKSTRDTAVVKAEIQSIPELRIIDNQVRSIPSQVEETFSFFLSSREQKEIAGQMQFVVRGGKSLVVDVKAKVIIPSVLIEEDDFDFGNISSQGPRFSKITFVNSSSIPAVLLINLDQEREVDIVPLPGEAYKDSQLIPIEAPKEIPEDLLDNIDNESEELEEIKDDYQSKNYELRIPPSSKTAYSLKFSPEVGMFGKRNIELPIEIKGAGKLANPKRVLADIAKAKIILEPPTKLDFEEKVVTGKPFPSPKDLHISSMDPDNALEWFIPPKIVEGNDGVWQINPYEGVIEPGTTVTVRVLFNPTRPGEFVRKVPLYLEGKKDQPHLEIELRGKGATPKLTYDKSEILIPPVPLDMESRAQFKVSNHGYENLDLSKNSVDLQDYPHAEIPVKLEFPENAKSVNVSKKELRIDCVFHSKVPINMTGKIRFLDDISHYPPDRIDVSAVADNCLLTNYSYIQRCREEVTFVPVKETILLKNEFREGGEDSAMLNAKMKPSGRALSKAGSTVSRTSRKAMSMFGYSPISPELHRRECDCIKRWLNNNVLKAAINYYPGDIIKQHGEQVLELIQYLSGKDMRPKGEPPADPGSKPEAETERARWKYEVLLNELTKYGAMLNTIRPEHLLNEEEYKRIKKAKISVADTTTMFTYLSEESWITLFYQIIKIFYLKRVNAENLKSIPEHSASEKVLPGKNSSNVYSDQEIVLLKWLEQCNKQASDYNDRVMTNFESDLQDSLVFEKVIKTYCRNVKGLNNMKPTMKTHDDYSYNAQKIIHTLKNELKLRTHITEADIIDPSARNMILFCTQLYLYLPYYYAREVVEFQCVLGETVTRKITLINGNNTRISYYPQLEGSSDFRLEKDEPITIEANSSGDFPVTFISRVSRSVDATLMFINQGDGPRQAAPLVFKLVSKITKRMPVDTISKNTDSNLYEPREIPIDIYNKFQKNARFIIRIEVVKASQEPVQKGKPKGKREKEPAGQVSILSTIPEPFFCKQDLIAVNKGQTMTLTVVFLPFQLGTHRCHVVMIDNDVGELQYDIVANANWPVPASDPITKTIVAERSQPIEISIPFQNIKMAQARTYLQSHCAKERKELERSNWDTYKQLVADQQALTVEISDTSGVFKVPQTITLFDKRYGKDMMTSKLDASKIGSDKLSEKGEEGKLVVEFFTKMVKKYETKIKIANQSKTDVRIFNLVVKTYPPPVFGQLTFNVPARQQVIQDIPINNESDRDWNIKVEMQQEKGQSGRFEVARSDVVALKKQVTNIQLKFIPEWVCECKGKLTINIITTNQMFVYELLGKGEEPLAEDKIVVECKARETTRRTLTIPNPTDKVCNYRVETDLSKVLWGDLSLKLMPREAGKYLLSITPLVGGIDMGSITFVDSENRYIWYVIELHVLSPEAEEEKPMETYVRRPIAYEFAIKNPLNEPVTFDVDIKGEGLIGDASLGVPANQTKIYELVYAPLKAGQSQGYINFLSEKAGEIKYKLALRAEESPAVALEFLEIELGRYGAHHVTLENPTKNEEPVVVHNSNPTNYDVTSKVIIPPYSTVEVPIRYIPSNLDATESARIVFESKNIGRWEFTLDGRGKQPTEMKPQRVTTTIGDKAPSSITFKNPLKEAATVEITLEPPEVKEFELLLKKNKVMMNPLSEYPIRFQFAPHSMSIVRATIVVSMGKALVWRFPLEGDAEYLAHGAPYHFKCQSRKRNQESIKLQLPDLLEVSPEDVFAIEAAPKEQAMAGIIERSVVIELNKQQLQRVDEPLELNVKFEPLRPFKAPCDLFVTKSSGGRWRFSAVFEAGEPEVDDIIEIKSPLHKTSSVSFKLTNHTRAYADFQAFFTHDSATEFSVYPKSGVLEPFGKDGTNFIVSFTPTEYGKNKTGKLVIQTEEMQWTYEIKGSHPEYKVPKPGGGRLDNKLSKDIESKIVHKGGMGQGKNFIVENIKKQKDLEKKILEEKKKREAKTKEASPGKSRSEFNISKYSGHP